MKGQNKIVKKKKKKIVCWMSDEIPPSLPSRTSNHWESCHPDVEFPQRKLH